jgi:hypothetical protein
LDQAKAAGVAFPTDPIDRLVTAITALVLKLGGDVPEALTGVTTRFAELGQKGTEAGDTIVAAMSGAQDAVGRLATFGGNPLGVPSLPAPAEFEPLPQFASEASILKSGAAIVDAGEYVMKSSTLGDIVARASGGTSVTMDWGQAAQAMAPVLAQAVANAMVSVGPPSVSLDGYAVTQALAPEIEKAIRRGDVRTEVR